MHGHEHEFSSFIKFIFSKIPEVYMPVKVRLDEISNKHIFIAVLILSWVLCIDMKGIL